MVFVHVFFFGTGNLKTIFARSTPHTFIAKNTVCFLFGRKKSLISDVSLFSTSKKIFTCSKKGGWGKKVKSHMCQCMTPKLHNYIFYDAKKLQNAKIEIFQLQNANFVLQNFSAFSTFLSKMVKFESIFFEKYEFLTNYQWFRQTKRFCHKVMLKVWEFTSEVGPTSKFVKIKVGSRSGVRKFSTKSFDSKFLRAHDVRAHTLARQQRYTSGIYST